MDGYVASLPSKPTSPGTLPGTRALCARVYQLENLACAQTIYEIHEDEDDSRMASPLQVQDWPVVKSCELLGQNSSQFYNVTITTSNDYTSSVNTRLPRKIRKYACGSSTEHNHYR